MPTNKFVFLLTVISIAFIASASAADIAYLVKTTSTADQFLKSEITSAGYTYDVIPESSFATADFSQYQLLIVGDDDFNSPESIPTELYNSLIINSKNYYLHLGSYQLGWSRSLGSTTSKIKTETTTTNITSGLPAIFDAYTITDPNVLTYYLTNPPSGREKIISINGGNRDGYLVVAALNPGQTLLNDKTLQKRNLFFGITDAKYWTPESRQLFKNSLVWLAQGSDIDGDNYTSEVDCNDNNPAIWQIVDAYPDIDNDLHGSINSLELCIGNSIPSGYFETASDCNDLDASIYFGAAEIPYDGIDQNCDAFDLTDVDADSFSSILVGGADCDDSNPLINPSSANLSSNCINDAPVIAEIPNISFREDATARIVVLASDPENDALTYSINDARFTVSNNIFSWQTSAGDAGNYSFIVSVSDSQLTSNQTVNLTITDTNHAPIISNIPEIAFGEDMNFTFNLSSYTSDPDSNQLTFGVHENPNDNIIVTQDSPGIFTLSPEKDWTGLSDLVFWISDGEITIYSNIVTLTVIPVNDAPIFNGLIETTTIEEDNSLENTLDLGDYFTDIDSELNYTLSGNTNIQASIANNHVTFTSSKDWFGNETVYFTATDGEFFSQSNQFTIIVTDMGEPPVISPPNCTSIIPEDTFFSCGLSAEDPENNSITFHASEQKHIVCTINNTTLTYKSDLNYNGPASCKVSASDKDGSDYIIINVTVTPINDAPSIKSSTPSGSAITIIEGKAQNFSISAEDPDSQLAISWLIDNETKQTTNSSSSSFNFFRAIGIYKLKALVSDSTNQTSRDWTVTVGPISDFTCSEVGGFICSNSQSCTGSLLGVKDSTFCCSTKCLPSFKKAESCKSTNSSLSLKLTNPSPDTKFYLNKNITTQLEISNKLDKKQNLDILISLYDITKDKSIIEAEDKLNVNADSTSDISLKLQVPSDLDITHEYVIFARAKDDICNQAYTNVSFERPTSLVQITSFDIPERATCGDIIKVNVEVENFGTKPQNVSLSIRSKDIKISEQSNSFNLESYSNDGRESVKVPITLSNNLESGKYFVEATASYGSLTSTRTAEIQIDCESTQVQSSVQAASALSAEPIVLNSLANANKQSLISGEDPMVLAGVLTLECMLLLGIIAAYMIFVKPTYNPKQKPIFPPTITQITKEKYFK